MAIGAVVAIISAITTAYSAYEQSESQKEAADQEEYNAEYEAQVAQMTAEQERMDNAQARKIAARENFAAQQRRVSFLTRAGGGIGVSAIAELTRQTSIDELESQNATVQSNQMRKQLGRSSMNALLSGKFKSRSLKSQSKSTFWAGQAKASSQGLGGFK